MSLLHDRRVTCEGCGANAHERTADGWQLPSNPAKPVLCAECSTIRRRAAENHQLPEVGECVRWSSALWTVTERDGDLTRIERAGTVPVLGVGALWASTSLLDSTGHGGQC